MPHVAVALQEGATTHDVCRALLHAAFLRRCVMERLDHRWVRRAAADSGSSSKGSGSSGSGTDDGGAEPTQREQRRRAHAAVAGVAGLSDEEMEKCIEESRRMAQKGVKRFVAEVTNGGWKTGNLLLSPVERTGYALQ